MFMQLFAWIYVGFGDSPPSRFSLLDSIFFDCGSAALCLFVATDCAFQVHVGGTPCASSLPAQAVRTVIELERRCQDHAVSGKQTCAPRRMAMIQIEDRNCRRGR
jgi:hypothetical protein